MVNPPAPSALRPRPLTVARRGPSTARWSARPWRPTALDTAGANGAVVRDLISGRAGSTTRRRASGPGRSTSARTRHPARGASDPTGERPDRRARVGETGAHPHHLIELANEAPRTHRRGPGSDGPVAAAPLDVAPVESEEATPTHPDANAGPGEIDTASATYTITTADGLSPVSVDSSTAATAATPTTTRRRRSIGWSTPPIRAR